MLLTAVRNTCSAFVEEHRNFLKGEKKGQKKGGGCLAVFEAGPRTRGKEKRKHENAIVRIGVVVLLGSSDLPLLSATHHPACW